VSDPYNLFLVVHFPRDNICKNAGAIAPVEMHSSASLCKGLLAARKVYYLKSCKQRSFPFKETNSASPYYYTKFRNLRLLHFKFMVWLLVFFLGPGWESRRL